MLGAPDILAFWFEELGPQDWFKSSDALDAKIRQRFEATALGLAAGSFPHDWEGAPESTLALILILDQFPRNIYRDTPAAFAWDDLALSVATRMVERGDDLKIPQARRAFLYMPFMHAEDLQAQDRCVALVDSRLNDASTLHHAREHRKVIARFGRFPHRNGVLGRPSTHEESAFLKAGGYSP